MARLFSCGVDFRTASIGRRETLAVASRDLGEQLRMLSARMGGGEAVLISTCNRVEIYALSDAPDMSATLRDWFMERAGSEILPSLNYWAGEAAVLHLYRVASGLESMIIGESEILGQVKTAYEAARQAGTAGRGFNILFQSAMGMGKKIRAHTPLSSGISSVGGAAAVLAAKIFGDLSDLRVLLIGAGKMAESSAKHLLAKKAKSLVVANRSLERAGELAQALGGQGVALSEGIDRLGDFDIVVCSTSCPGTVLDARHASAAIKERRGRPIFIIDIAVPRDVSPDAGELEGVFLYNIDSLEALVKDSIVQRSGAVESAERTVSEGAAELISQRCALYGLEDAYPTARALGPCFI